MIQLSMKRCCVLLLVLCNSSLHAQIQLAFAGTPTLSGTAGTVGAKYTYGNIGTSGSTTLKGVVQIIAISGAALDNIDGPPSAGGLDNAFQPVISGSQTSGNCWSIQFRISFLDATTNLPVTLTSFRSTGVDIDGNGSSLKEYNTFVGPDSYTLDNPTNLTASVSGSSYKFLSPTTSYGGIALTQTNVAVTCLYSNRSSVDLIIGSCCPGASCSVAPGSGRQHSINFYDAVPYTAPNIILPVTLSNWSASRSRESVELSWRTEDETRFSRFAVERSDDGNNFVDIATVEALGTGHTYHYTDVTNTGSVVYYRLKMVDRDDKYSYSQILRVVADDEQSAGISVYPNPVQDIFNLRVVSRKNENIKIQVFNDVGLLVRSLRTSIVTGANLIELTGTSLNKKGLYFLQVISSDGTRTVKAVKF